MDEMPAATTREGLADNLKPAWKKVPHGTINNLINGIPECMQASVQERGGYMGNQTVSPLRLFFATTTMIQTAINFGTPCTYVCGHHPQRCQSWASPVSPNTYIPTLRLRTCFV